MLFLQKAKEFFFPLLSSTILEVHVNYNEVLSFFLQKNTTLSSIIRAKLLE
jgi:hypothetical protein